MDQYLKVDQWKKKSEEKEEEKESEKKEEGNFQRLVMQNNSKINE